jgi:hypothetical protein
MFGISRHTGGVSDTRGDRDDGGRGT